MNKSRGFTLLEVMIALTLLSMIMAATVAAMRTFGNTKQTLEGVTSRVDEIRSVSEFLRNSIGGALPVPGEDESGDAFAEEEGQGIYFGGDNSQLMWVAPLVGGSGIGGVYIMLLAQVEDSLELKWHPYIADVNAVSWGDIKPRTLVQSLDDFEVGYLAEYDGEWEAAWPGAQALPVAVRLQVRAAQRYWPELVIGLSGEGFKQ